MPDVTMYSAQGCRFCQSAEQLLKRRGVDRLTTIQVDTEPEQLARMIAITGRRTVPQIFIGSIHVGGFDNLATLARSGHLDELLRA